MRAGFLSRPRVARPIDTLVPSSGTTRRARWRPSRGGLASAAEATRPSAAMRDAANDFLTGKVQHDPGYGLDPELTPIPHESPNISWRPDGRGPG